MSIPDNPHPDIPLNCLVRFTLKNKYWRTAQPDNEVMGQYGWNPVPYIHGEWGIRTLERDWLSHNEIVSWEAV